MTEKKIQLDLVVLIILFLTGKGDFVKDLITILIMQFCLLKQKLTFKSTWLVYIWVTKCASATWRIWSVTNTGRSREEENLW